jgi:hypothetical protein
VQQLQAQVGVDARAQALVLGGGGLHVERLRLLDERADDERLSPLLDLGAEEALGVLAGVRRDPARLDGLAAGRQLIDHGDVEVAVDGEGERARDGRGGHDEHVRRVGAEGALLAQGGALHDAEAVLLIDDGEAEVVEADAALDQRVRAAGDVDLAALERLVDLAPLLRLEGAGEQRDAERTGEVRRPRRRDNVIGGGRAEEAVGGRYLERRDSQSWLSNVIRWDDGRDAVQTQLAKQRIL